MKLASFLHSVLGAVGLSLAVLLSRPSAAQAQFAGNPYANMYQTRVAGMPMTPGSDRWMYEKYFATNPAVSPYSAVILGGTDSGTAYTARVRPAVEQRDLNLRSQAAYVQQRKQQGNIGYTAYPGAGFIGGTPAHAIVKPVPAGHATPSYYHNHWYGGWMNR